MKHFCQICQSEPKPSCWQDMAHIESIKVILPAGFVREPYEESMDAGIANRYAVDNPPIKGMEE